MQVSAGRKSSLSPESVATFLTSTELFASLPAQVAAQISTVGRALDYRAGEVVMAHGHGGGDLGLVFAGRISVVALEDGERHMLYEVPRGGSFGEVGALLRRPEETEATARENSTVLFLPGKIIDQLSSKLPQFSRALADSLATKLARVSVAATAVAAAPASDGGRDVRFVKLAAYDLSHDLLDMIPAKIRREHRLVPLKLVGRRLTVGMVDPFSRQAQAELSRLLTSVDFDVVAVSESEWQEMFSRMRMDSAGGPRRRQTRLTGADIEFDNTDQERESENPRLAIGEEVVSIATKIVAAGIQHGASDIHIESQTKGVRVRFRVGGVLIDSDSMIASNYARGLAARFKVLAGLDITERRRPQDGRIRIRAAGRDVDLRVSSMPAIRGEKLVMRIFEEGNILRPLEKIFAENHSLEALRTTLQRPFGAVLVAGPTGSGKTTTLYSALAERKKTRPDNNIVMIEDPVEFRLDGVTQIQANHQIDLSYAKILRGVLRQDPDVIMVGEIRDEQTAELALQASLTGHLLLTSVHANNAIGVLQRLESFGLHRTVLAQSLSLILVQRLASKLCQQCLAHDPPPPALAKTLTDRGLIAAGPPEPLPRSLGCDACDQTGVSGRVAVIESMQMTDHIRNQLMAGATMLEVERAAIEARALVPYRTVARFMMGQSLIGPSEALLVVS